MSISPNPSTQSKLAQGLEKLKQTTPEDTAGMGAALAQLHEAMEDFVRFELTQKAPHLRTAAEDPKTSWKDLLEQGRTYLGFTENDCNILTEAEAQRQAATQGRGFTYTYTDLVNYAQFVQKWVKWSNVSAKSAPSTHNQWVSQGQAYTPASPEPSRPWDDRDYLLKAQRKSWYRSTPVLFILFFLFPPLWAMLILTDRGQNGLLRGLAALEIAIAFFICAYFFLPMPSIYSDAVRDLWQLVSGAATPTQALATIPTVPPVSASPPSLEAGSPTSGSSACSVAWVEGPGDALAGKNRSMAWADVIRAKVEGSGMTSDQFYDLVVEHNPQLVTDGYVFLAGKTYSLPECDG